MGVTFNSEQNQFIFDFEHDGKNDIIELTGCGYDVTAFRHCFYYGYEFSDDIDGFVSVGLTSFLNNIPTLKDYPDVALFIRNAIDNLHRIVNLYNYNLVIMPESPTKIYQYTIRYIYRFAQPLLRGCHKVLSLNPQNGIGEEKDELLCKTIRQQNVLVIDYIATSGSTLNEVLRTLRILNEDNKITIFSLIGRKDLTIESMD